MKLLPLLIMWVFVACSSTDKTEVHQGLTNNTEVRVIVIKWDNQNFQGVEKMVDTVFNQIVDLSQKAIDVYFAQNHFQLPYYLPTNSVYKDSIKEKECNWKDYPHNVKCYEYDTKGRVIKMDVEGSGTTGYHIFSFDDKDRIIEMTDNSSNKYKMTYDLEGRLTQIVVSDGVVMKRLRFFYN